MPPIDSAYLEHQLKRWMRPDAHLFVRPDWRKFVRPGFEAGHPFALYERKYRPDQARVPPGSREGGQWTDEEGGGGGVGAEEDLSARIWVAGDVVPICIVEGKGASQTVLSVSLIDVPTGGPFDVPRRVAFLVLFFSQDSSAAYYAGGCAIQNVFPFQY